MSDADSILTDADLRNSDRDIPETSQQKPIDAFMRFAVHGDAPCRGWSQGGRRIAPKPRSYFLQERSPHLAEQMSKLPSPRRARPHAPSDLPSDQSLRSKGRRRG